MIFLQAGHGERPIIHLRRHPPPSDFLPTVIRQRSEG